MDSYTGRRFGPGRLKSRPVGSNEYEHYTTIHITWKREVKGWLDWGYNTLFKNLLSNLFSPRNQIE